MCPLAWRLFEPHPFGFLCRLHYITWPVKPLATSDNSPLSLCALPTAGEGEGEAESSRLWQKHLILRCCPKVTSLTQVCSEGLVINNNIYLISWHLGNSKAFRNSVPGTGQTPNTILTIISLSHLLNSFHTTLQAFFHVNIKSSFFLMTVLYTMA